MSNESKAAIAFIALIVACLIVMATQWYQTVYATATIECGKTDPRIEAPYSLSKCDNLLTFYPCLFERIAKNHRAIVRYEKCISKVEGNKAHDKK
jgi:hypothetical protein